MSSRSTIRVALVAPTPEMPGGHAVQAQRLLSLFDGDEEVRVRLVPIDPPPPRALSWTSRVKYARTLVKQLCYWPLLLRSTRSADVVHVFCASNSSFWVAAFPAIVAGTIRGKAVVANYRGDGRDHLARSRFVRWILRRLCTNVVPSAYFDAIFREMHIPATVVPNPADLDRFRFRARGAPRGRILSTRNLEPIYNVACTLRAFALVQAAIPDASLVIVGTGSEAASLERLAADLALRNAIFAGRVTQHEIARHYADADVYVQTPTVDNMPASVIEAFASGVPVVSTSVGGVPAILEDGVHGLLAPANDHGAIAARVVTLLRDAALGRRLAAAAFETCRKYDGARVREQWRTVYRSVAADLRRAGALTVAREGPAPVAIGSAGSGFDEGGR